jgi:hypothetical protein
LNAHLFATPINHGLVCARTIVDVAIACREASIQVQPRYPPGISLPPNVR